MSKDLDLAKLRAVAEAATEGEWDWSTANSVRYLIQADTHSPVVYAYRSPIDSMPDLSVSVNDAEHIAAFDPPTALALLDRVEELEGRVIDLRHHLRTTDDCFWRTRKELERFLDLHERLTNLYESKARWARLWKRLAKRRGENERASLELLESCRRQGAAFRALRRILDEPGRAQELAREALGD